MKPVVLAICCGATAAALFAQQFKFDLDGLSAKASETAEVNVPGPLLKLGARFLDSNKPDEAAVSKLVAGLDGIYVRHFTFKRDGAWTPADLEGIRSQLKSPEWQRLVGWKGEGGENAEVYLRLEGGKMTGLAILDTEPREFTVVNIVGSIDLEALAQLGGHFGVPKLQNDEKVKNKDKTSKKE